MKIKWLGQSCFDIVTESGVRIATDPFAHVDPVNFPGLEIKYPTPDLTPDVLIISHRGHFDHDAEGIVKGSPVVLDKPGSVKVKGVEFKSFGTYHRTGNADGLSADPFNNVFYWEADGLKICHTGDLGYVLGKEEMEKIKGTDVLFVPVGEGFTMPHADVIENIRLIGPKVVIPMHYKTDEVAFLPKSLDDFLAVCDLEVQRPEEPFVVTKDTLPASAVLYVLKKPQ